MRPWPRGALLLLAALLVGAGPAAARPVRRDAPAAPAQALLTRGRTALEAKDLVGARRALEQAYRAAATAEVLFLLGRVAAAEGRILDAHDLMRRYLIDPARAPDDAAVAEAQRIVKLSRPPSGQIVVLGDPGSVISIDDHPVGSVPLSQALLVSPGEHHITLERGSRRLDTPVVVQAGRSFEVRFTSPSGAVLITLLPAMLWVLEQSGVSEAAQNPLADAAELAARAEQQTLLSSEAALARAPELAKCLTTPECQQKLARSNEVEYVLSTRLRYEAPKEADAAGNWQLELTLRHAELGTAAATGTGACQRCTAEQAAAALKQASAKLLAAGLRREHGGFAITSEPPAAQVLIDGKAVGVTPYQLAAWVGSYQLELRQPGFEPAQRTLEVHEGPPEPLAVTLTRLSGPEPAPSLVKTPAAPLPAARRPTWRLATGGALLSAGVLIGGFGVAALYADGQCSGPLLTDICPFTYSTYRYGVSLTPVGAALATTGIILLALPPPKPKKLPH